MNLDVSRTVKGFQASSTDFVLALMDDQQQSLECEESPTVRYLETGVSKDEEYWIGAALRVKQFVLTLHGNVYGQDCDKNCCCDVYMMDTYAPGLGDGWNGAEVEVTQSGSVIDTLLYPLDAVGLHSASIMGNHLSFMEYQINRTMIRKPLWLCRVMILLEQLSVELTPRLVCC